jgi:glycosyltransferase 2 family protein
MYKILLAFLAIPLLWWSLRDIPLPEIYETLLGVSPLGLLGLALLNGFIFLLFTSRWWLLIRALGNRLPFLSLAAYRLAAFGITYFTPGPQFGGEPMQVHLAQRRHNLSGSVALAGVAIDKLVELLMNFSFLVFGLILVIRSQLLDSESSNLLLSFGLGMLALPVAYLSLLWVGHTPFSTILNHLPISAGRLTLFNRVKQPLSAAEKHVSGFIRQKPQDLAAALGLSLLSWLLMVAEYGLALRVLGIQLETAQVIIALTAARIAFLLPIPAGLGALEAGQVAAMQMLGVEPALGISISLLIRARDLGLGILGLWLGGFLTRLGPLHPTTAVQPINIRPQRRN